MLNRRQLIQLAGAGAALGTSSLANLAQAAGGFSDYRALVCVYLFGGNDSFNMVVPTSTAEYNAYAASRQTMAVASGDLLPISPLNPDGAQYGIHPSMQALRALFESERMAFVTNVGPLVEPVSKDAYLNQTVEVPPHLFSHNSQQDQWQSLQGMDALKTGWGGRISDLFNAELSGQRLPVNVSLRGNQLMMTANQTNPYVIGYRGPEDFDGLDKDPSLRRAFEKLNDDNGESSLYEQALMDVQNRALHIYDRVEAAIDNAQQVSVAFPQTALGDQLRTVARMISARNELQMQRQIFFVGMRGFDTHDDQMEVQPGLFAELSQCLNAFYLATQELGVAENVTTFTESDFGRTLTSNGDGTDHGWGGIQLVMGGSVQGRRIYGSFPTLEMGGPDEVNEGRLIPTTSADQYVATLSKWFGVSNSNLNQIAPNLRNFAVRDLGFVV
ncbi:MAG: DUF1501 domain-containing protein [Gammaproteobacteria bacterium]